MMYCTKSVSTEDGWEVATYSRRILLAVVNHREWLIGPGFCNAKWGGTDPFLIPLNILRRYFWSQLRSLSSVVIFVALTALKSTISNSSQQANRFPTRPAKFSGPLVPPSSSFMRCRKGNSFVCNRQIIHCKGLSKCSSRSLITPPFRPVFTAVPPHPIAVTSPMLISFESRWAIIPLNIDWLDPEAAVKWPTYWDCGSLRSVMCSSTTVRWCSLPSISLWLRVWSLLPSKCKLFRWRAVLLEARLFVLAFFLALWTLFLSITDVASFFVITPASCNTDDARNAAARCETPVRSQA